MFFKRRKDEEEDKIKLLVITRTESETVIIESLLNAEEIPFMIKHGNLYEYFANIPNFEKVHARMYVPECMFDRAREIIMPPDEVDYISDENIKAESDD
ncbi:MAG: hypothetical protein R2876_06760 [Eubacteriales bacterium]